MLPPESHRAGPASRPAPLSCAGTREATNSPAPTIPYFDFPPPTSPSGSDSMNERISSRTRR
jgi:hypothetical protein